MIVDYLPHFEPRRGSEFHRILTALDPESRVYGAGIVPRYRRRLTLLLYWTPRLLLYGCAEVWRYCTAPKSAAVVAWDYVPLLPILLARSWRRRAVRLVLVGFIFTRRRARWLDWLRRILFRQILARIDRIVVHSTDEVGHYARLFGLPSEKFVFLPVALHVAPLAPGDAGPTHGLPPVGLDRSYVAAAGRSNRDYALLLRVAAELPVRFKIVCDAAVDVAEPLPPNVEILRDCHGTAYLQVLAGAAVVAIPLKSDQLSAGQMVLLHAMALGRAIVVTKTSAIVDYVEDGKTALLVERGSAASLKQALLRLLHDTEERHRLEIAARQRFETRHTLAASLRELHARVVE